MGYSVTRPTRLRLFIAVEVPDAWRSRLAEVVTDLEAEVPGTCRWARSESYHMTLVFIGEQPPPLVPEVALAMADAGAANPGFTLHPAGLGSFGSRASLSVVWAAVADDPSGALTRLRGALTDALRGKEIPFDQAAFRAHVTLGRVRRDASSAGMQAMRAALRDAPRWGEGEASVTEIVLFRSDLRPMGAVYTALERASLRDPHP